MQDKLREKYKQFVEDKELIEACKPYEIFGQRLVVEIFAFDPSEGDEERPTILLDQTGKSNKDLEEPRYYAVGKVLSVGSDVEYNIEPGDFVSLNDWIATTIVNPFYSAWTQNELKNSNASRVGSEPLQKISNIRQLVRDTFIPTKISWEQSDKEMFAFCLPIQGVVAKIKDPYAVVRS